MIQKGKYFGFCFANASDKQVSNVELYRIIIADNTYLEYSLKIKKKTDECGK